MYGEELLQYCITHSKTPNPRYSGEQFARMIELANNPGDFPTPEEIREEARGGGYYQLGEEMEALIEMAQNRVQSIKSMDVSDIIKDMDRHINTHDWWNCHYSQLILHNDTQYLYYPITDETKNIRNHHIKIQLTKGMVSELLEGMKAYLIKTEFYELIGRVDNKINELKNVGQRKVQTILD